MKASVPTAPSKALFGGLTAVSAPVPPPSPMVPVPPKPAVSVPVPTPPLYHRNVASEYGHFAAPARSKRAAAVNAAAVLSAALAGDLEEESPLTRPVSAPIPPSPAPPAPPMEPPVMAMHLKPSPPSNPRVVSNTSMMAPPAPRSQPPAPPMTAQEAAFRRGSFDLGDSVGMSFAGFAATSSMGAEELKRRSNSFVKK